MAGHSPYGSRRGYSVGGRGQFLVQPSVLHESSERRCAIGSGSDPLQAQHLDDLPTRDDRALMHGLADNRTISQLEAEGYPWIGCECCKGTVWVPFRMLREQIPMLSAMTLDQLGARMRCDKSGKRPERYYPANQSDTPWFVQRK
jgi:hypothetical protein